MAEYRLIPLTGKYGEGKFAKVDAADFDWLSEYTWWGYCNRDKAIYAVTRYGGRTTVGMHRIIMGDPDGLEIDHENRDTLDNRRQNLRPATRLQNSWNSERVNVFEIKKNGRWAAQFYLEAKAHTLGSYATREEAERAFSSAALHYRGEFARVPFQDEQPKTVVQLRRGALELYNQTHGVTKFRGVMKKHQRWNARITVSGKNLALGTFDTPEEAARAYDAAIDKHERPAWMKNFYPGETE